MRGINMSNFLGVRVYEYQDPDGKIRPKTYKSEKQFETLPEVVDFTDLDKGKPSVTFSLKSGKKQTYHIIYSEIKALNETSAKKLKEYQENNKKEDTAVSEKQVSKKQGPSRFNLEVDVNTSKKGNTYFSTEWGKEKEFTFVTLIGKRSNKRMNPSDYDYYSKLEVGYDSYQYDKESKNLTLFKALVIGSEE